MLRFKLTDYHAIKDADIKIDGITVLAGENGSGKSTLSRWLFYLINSMSDFEVSLFNNLIDSFNNEIARFTRISADASYRNTVYNLFLSLNYSNHSSFPNLSSDLLTSLEHVIEGLLSDECNNVVISRLLQVLGLGEYNNKETLLADVKDSFKVMRGYYVSLYNDFTRRLQTHYINDLYEIISDKYYPSDDFPHNVALIEKGVNLISDNCFIEPLSVRRSLYIDSSVPTSNSLRSNDDVIGTIARKMIMQSSKKELDENERRILLLLNKIIKGKITLADDAVASKELRYRRNDGLEIPLRNAASGIQSIAYLYRMLECGYLDEDTILLIDEPETHLHPQWVVEYANILVRLYKDLDVKIVIASHSPDMISALETISRRHELEDVTRFYQAKQGADLKYTFKDFGMNISGIFESFNVAFSKMQDYGAVDL